MIRLKTAFNLGDIPLSEHPAPQREREDFLILNGKWNLQKIDGGGAVRFCGEILVPFSPEALNSGVEEGFTLEQGCSLIYERAFIIEQGRIGKKALLHFGAVDSSCKVFLNGKEVGAHTCGYTAFCFNVTDFLLEGENRLRVEVTDEATRNASASGKQKDKHGGIWYTPQSGIWQTVWLEFMPKISINDIKITPLSYKKAVKITFDCAQAVRVIALDEQRVIFDKKVENQVVIESDFEFWSPENPKLYNLILQNDAGDKVKSYFGYRFFSVLSDGKGRKRFALNGKPYFFNGVLDQGYWSDGLLTYPSDAAAYEELKRLKEMGFNTVRKHIKIEPLRWYYHCDKLGLIVWQDFVNGGEEYITSHVTVLPFLGFNHRDDDYKYFSREDIEGRQEFERMMEDVMSLLYNCVSVGLYVPFNEGWGQFDSERIISRVKELDGSRLIDGVSGWHDQGASKTPVKSLHTYYTPLKVHKKEKRVVVLDEFGGYSMPIEGHVYNPKKLFGYKMFKSRQKLEKALEKLYIKKLLPLIKKGLCGAIYTQVSDVEEEINGLFTFDRRVQKISTEKMREINDKLKAEWQSLT